MCCIVLVRCVLVLRCGSAGVVWPVSACIRIPHHTTPPQPNHNVTSTHIEPEQYNHEITQQISRKLLRMDVVTSETCWAVNNEIKRQVTSSWSLFIQLSKLVVLGGNVIFILPIHYTLYTIHYTLYNIHCTLYTIHYTIYTIHYTLHIGMSSIKKSLTRRTIAIY